MDKMHLTLMVATLSCLVLMESVNAFTHIVGGNHGWRVPDNKTFFQDWAKPRTFGVGDKLVFPYRPGANNLMAVKKPDFDKCEQDDPINMYFQGPTILELTKPGDYYYYDGIGKHCEAGMKLHIVVGTKEGSSGENMPFKLDTFVIRTSSLTTTSAATAPAAAASGPSATVFAASSGPSATVSAASTGPSASASATAAAPKASAATATHKLGFGVMLVAMALSMFLLV